MINKLKILRQKSWLFEFMSDNVLWFKSYTHLTNKIKTV